MNKAWGVSARAAVKDDRGRILLLRRSNNSTSWVGCWEWPGGKANPGEDIADAAVREAGEETGLTIEVTGLAALFHFEMPRVNVITACFECRTVGGTLRLSDEHDQVAWVAPADLAKYNLVDAHRDAMLAYARRQTA